ncbi:hypothetical protein Tco_1073846 [Tanacetum coccineum]
MHENKSFNRNPANHTLYHALMEALIEDENAMDKGVVDTGRRVTGGVHHTTKETSKGKAPTKSSKNGKSETAKEPVEKPIAEVVMDDAVNDVGEDVVCEDDQPQDTSKPKIYKTLNQDWFKQPQRLPTPRSEC